MPSRDGGGMPPLVTQLPPRTVRTVAAVDRRPARVARMLALVHHIEAGLGSGRWESASEVARALGMSRNRLSQVLALLNLAPDLQEAVLFLEAVDGVEPMTERWLFEEIARLPEWTAQRRKYQDAVRSCH